MHQSLSNLGVFEGGLGRHIKDVQPAALVITLKVNNDHSQDLALSDACSSFFLFRSSTPSRCVSSRAP